MDLKRCINNHYYDSDKYSQCPHCANKAKQEPREDDDRYSSQSGVSYRSYLEEAEDEPVIDLNSEKDEEQGREEFIPSLYPPEEDMGGATVGYFQDEVVVGWLAAIEGEHKGESFHLKEGMNYVGRAPAMDVCLIKDKGISRNRHITIIYDARNNEFVVHMGESKELVYVNGELLLEPKKLQRNDKISLGKTVLMFIPLCDENFMWE